MKLKNGFERGGSTWECDTCGKLTRDTGRGETDGVCAKCYDEGGFENEHQNYGEDHNGSGPLPNECPLCRGNYIDDFDGNEVAF